MYHDTDGWVMANYNYKRRNVDWNTIGKERRRHAGRASNRVAISEGPPYGFPLLGAIHLDPSSCWITYKVVTPLPVSPATAPL